MLALRYSDEIGELDLVRSGDGYAEDDTSATLVFTSIFTDQRAAGEVGPSARGYWADDMLGSKLWQFIGRVKSDQARLDFEAELRRCMSWLESAGRFTVGSIVSELVGTSLNGQVEISRGDKSDIVKFGREAGLYGA